MMGEWYSAIYAMHYEEFEDDDRIDDYYKCIWKNTDDIEDGHYCIDDGMVDKYASMKSEIPAIVLTDYGDVVDGNHRLAAAKKNDIAKIKVLVPVSKEDIGSNAIVRSNSM